MSTPLTTERIAAMRKIPSDPLSIGDDAWGAFLDDTVSALDELVVVRAALGELVRRHDEYLAEFKQFGTVPIAMAEPMSAAWAAARAVLGRDAVPPNGGQQCET